MDKKKWEWVVLPQYEHIYLSEEFFVELCQNKKCGVCDKNFEQVLPLIYDYIRIIDEGRFFVCINNKYQMIKPNGEVLTSFDCDFFYWYSTNHYCFFCMKVNEKYGYVDINGTILVPCIYDYLDSSPFMSYYQRAKFNNKYGLINMKNETIIPFLFDDIKLITDYTELQLYAIKLNNKWGVINLQFEQVFRYWYNSIDHFESGVVRVGHNGKYCLVNETGHEITNWCDNIRVNHFGDCDNEVIAVCENDLWGFVNTEGKLIVLFQYEFVENVYNGDILLWYIKKNNKYGVMSAQGQIILDCDNDEIEWHVYGFIKVKKRGKWGAFDYSGNLILSCCYDNVIIWGDGYFAVLIDDKWGCIDVFSDYIIECKYDAICTINNDEKKYLGIMENNKWGIIDKYENLIIPCQFDETGFLIDGLLPVMINNKWGVVKLG